MKVDLNQGTAHVELKPGNQVTLQALQRAIQKNGFVNKQDEITAVGTITKEGGELQFTVSNSGERFSLRANAGRENLLEQAATLAGKNVLVSGSVPAPPKGQTAATTLMLDSITAQQ